MIIGYTTGAFDLFHIGHLNILKKAKERCDYLIVGVTTDEFIGLYKDSLPSIKFQDRASIVFSIKYVDRVVPQFNHDKLKQWEEHKFNIMFVGDDWKGTKKWNIIEEQMNSVNVEVFYFERTKGISTSMIKNEIEESK
tara:strand:- start:39 stop:452 length:414 start_codon:yes stop_codon:yes gene_type:complete